MEGPIALMVSTGLEEVPFDVVGETESTNERNTVMGTVDDFRQGGSSYSLGYSRSGGSRSGYEDGSRWWASSCP